MARDPAGRKESDVHVWIISHGSEPDAFRRYFAFWDQHGYGVSVTWRSFSVNCGTHSHCRHYDHRLSHRYYRHHHDHCYRRHHNDDVGERHDISI